MKNGQVIRVASYNIHQSIGSDGRMDPGRIARVIQEMNCSVVGLQEVSSRTGGDPTLSHLHFLADAIGMEAIPGPTVIRGNSHYGNVLMTRFPVEEISRQDLSVEGREPRGTVEAVLDIAGKKLRVIVTHLGLKVRERKQQAEILVRSFDSSFPTLLLGDINEWLPFRSCLSRLQDCFGRAKGLRTYPARWPILALDRIWAVPPELLISLSVHKTPVARVASDHLPVKATIRLR